MQGFDVKVSYSLNLVLKTQSKFLALTYCVKFGPSLHLIFHCIAHLLNNKRITWSKLLFLGKRTVHQHQIYMASLAEMNKKIQLNDSERN